MAPSRLSPSLLRSLPASVQGPAYDRSAVTPGIMHIGVGSFHRAHQAVYIDDCLAGDPRWGIIGVSMRRPDMRDALAPQGFLYTVASRDGSGDRCRVIGSLLDILVAQDSTDAIIARLADPEIRIVSLTVTEKGYCLDPASGKLDPAHSDIVADLHNPARPQSLPGLIVTALGRRRALGLEPFTLLSCDNLRKNGQTARAAIIDFAAIANAELTPWLEDRLACPSTMVDRIVPKTSDGDIASVERACGYVDGWPVIAEPFSQWVIEDDFPLGRPPFANPEISLVSDVHQYEEMKLRLLNGTHSALAYTGLLAGHETVAEAMADAAIVDYLKRLAAEDLVPSLNGPAGVDLDAYVRSFHLRFSNPGIRHELIQIAADGSQKLPQRLLPAMRQRVRQGAGAASSAMAIAAWIHCWQRAVHSSPAFSLLDPMAAALLRAANRQGGPADAVQAVFALPGLFEPGDHDRFGPAVTRCLATLVSTGLHAALVSIDQEAAHAS